MKRLVDARNARTPEYKKVIERIAKDGNCPFCPDNFRYHTRRILKRQGKWLITRNFNPYPSTRYHFILIGEKHKTRAKHLTTKDFAEIGQLVQWAEQTYNIQGGAIAMRFGNTRYTGATVSHMHCHLIVPKLEYRKIGGKTQRVASIVSFPIG
jgi:ATP adenylyltransferase